MTAPDAARPEPGCPLCAAAPAGLLWESPQIRVIAVDDAGLPGYVRVIWRAHVSEMTDLSASERRQLMDIVWRVESSQRRILQPDKINLTSLGNQVAHLHWHLIPRWRGDPTFPGAIWTTPVRDPERLAAWARHCTDLAPRVTALHQAVRAALRTPQ